MWKHILCPLDSSKASKRALREAILLAKHFGGTISVVHIVAVVVEGLFDELAVPEKLKEFGKELLDEAVKKGEQAGGVVVNKLPLAIGIPEEAIVAIAKDKGCDVIIMGTHGRKGLERMTLGSVCEYVIRNASVPVMCLRGVDDGKLDVIEERVPMTRILFPFDNSDISNQALKALVVPIAKASNAEVHFRYQVESNSGADKEKQAAEVFMEEARGEATKTLAKEKVYSTVVVSNGHVADSLSSAGKDYDLVIMSTHGRRGMARLFMGSVTETVLRSCNTAVLTYHPKS